MYDAYVYEPLLGTTFVVITSLSHLQYLTLILSICYFVCNLLKYILKIQYNKENIYQKAVGAKVNKRVVNSLYFSKTAMLYIWTVNHDLRLIIQNNRKYHQYVYLCNTCS